MGIAAIAYGTLSGNALPYTLYFGLAPWLGHPKIHIFALMEHLAVFGVFGALLFFAFPDRTVSVCAAIIVCAMLLEYLQTFTPDRHGTLVDAFEKVTGGLSGVLAAYIISARRGTA